jgi:tetratricopeptide (TPR) repeat protein
MLASHDENPIEDDELLTGTGSGGVFTSGYLRERPLIEYLDESERVAFLLSNSKKGVREESGDGGTAYTPGDGYQAIAAVTDTRIMFVVGDAEQIDGDAMFAVPYTEIEDVKTNSGVLKKRVDVWTTSGTRWRFYVKSSVDLQPAADYVDLAAVVWTRVENQLGQAREHLARVSDLVDDREFAAAAEAGSEARAFVDEARRMATELTENRSDAVWEQILGTEERLDAAVMNTHREWATYHEQEAERQWRKELYNQAYESYEAAREEYEAALDVARNQRFPDTDDLVAEIDDVRHDLDDLSKSPLQRAEQTRARAESLTDPAVAVEAWEEALERYQTTLVLGWGDDEKRFAGDSDEIRAEIETIVDRIVEARTELADGHEASGDEHFTDGTYERARRQYATAKDHLSQAIAVAEELRPSRLDELRARQTEVEDRVAVARERADDNPFEFVGDRTESADTKTTGANRSSSSLLDELEEADPETFVDLVASAWDAMGWTTTVRTDREGRVDVVAEKTDPVPETQLVVAKQAARTVEFDADHVRNLAETGTADYDADVVALVTTGSFTVDARTAAAETSVKLVSGDRLVDLLDAESVADLDLQGRRHAAD